MAGVTTSLLWVRRDLRLHDHPALCAAAQEGAVLPVFVLEPTLLQESPVRTHALLSALHHLQELYDGALVFLQGPAQQAIPQLAAQVKACSVHISAEPQPWGYQRDREVEQGLSLLPTPVPLVRTGSPYAVTPGRVRTGGGRGYRVFTPFSKAWRDHGWPRPAQAPTGLRWHRGVESLPLPPLPDLPVSYVQPVDSGQQRALLQWHHFLHEGLPDYEQPRGRLDQPGTTGLSVHLKFGSIHPRTLLADLGPLLERTPGAGRLLTQLCWREFYADVLWHHPDSAWSDLSPALAGMRYADPDTDPDVAAGVQAWEQGRTGFPVVDAGMRQMVATGWMHNRARMITASFLTKDLRVWWPHGARVFLRHLHDGDLANNNHGWQWVAGTGTDAAPYFRVFNPVTQGQRYDPDGAYVRRWVPELAHLGGAAAHEPWKHPQGYQHGYPPRILDHAQARQEALAAYQAART